MEVKKQGKWVLDPTLPRAREYFSPPQYSHSCDLSQKSRVSSRFARLVRATFLQKRELWWSEFWIPLMMRWDEMRWEMMRALSHLLLMRDESSSVPFSGQCYSGLLWRFGDDLPSATMELCRCTLWTKKAGGGQLTKYHLSSARGEIG